MSEKSKVDISVFDRIDKISELDWERCAQNEKSKFPKDPFTTYRFLKALEDSASVGGVSGWLPRYLVAKINSLVIGVAPMYGKTHSQGEYVFDHSWAHAYQRAGGSYYPKIQIAVPFTPVTGRRFLVCEGYEELGIEALMNAAKQMCLQHNISGVHITFCTESEVEIGKEQGFLYRKGQQFHWLNKKYSSFDEFLSSLASRKRKAIRKERRIANTFGGEIVWLTGAQISLADWQDFWLFYQDTSARKWGQPYLTKEFFFKLHEVMRKDVLLIMCRREGKNVAGALNFISNEVLYGRYWGCLEDHSFLHFEVCYYQAIEYAINNNLSRVEAGAQGHHKLARGYMPVSTHSLHWVKEDNFKDAIGQFLASERNVVDEENEILTSYGPFKKNNLEENYD
ncbi:MAG: GNAT family N-acetyltransferase [Paracoccaceae bacterium]|jgi:predicted N-acyltransferase|nr:GNAT family N-acetyltransferase [Paracoccaceae bacterium]